MFYFAFLVDEYGMLEIIITRTNHFEISKAQSEYLITRIWCPGASSLYLIGFFATRKSNMRAINPHLMRVKITAAAAEQASSICSIGFNSFSENALISTGNKSNIHKRERVKYTTRVNNVL